MIAAKKLTVAQASGNNCTAPTIQPAEEPRHQATEVNIQMVHLNVALSFLDKNSSMPRKATHHVGRARFRPHYQTRHGFDQKRSSDAASPPLQSFMANAGAKGLLYYDEKVFDGFDRNMTTTLAMFTYWLLDKQEKAPGQTLSLSCHRAHPDGKPLHPPGPRRWHSCIPVYHYNFGIATSNESALRGVLQ